jgi:hypothetical protein
LTLLLLFTGLALLVARRSVDASAERVADNPLKTTVVGWSPRCSCCRCCVDRDRPVDLDYRDPAAAAAAVRGAGAARDGLVGFTGTAAAIGNAVQRRYRARRANTLTWPWSSACS